MVKWINWLTLALSNKKLNIFRNISKLFHHKMFYTPNLQFSWAELDPAQPRIAVEKIRILGSFPTDLSQLADLYSSSESVINGLLRIPGLVRDH